MRTDPRTMERHLVGPMTQHSLAKLPMPMRARVRAVLTEIGKSAEERFCRVGREERGWFVLHYDRGNPSVIWIEWEDQELGGFRLGFVYERDDQSRLPLAVKGSVVFVAVNHPALMIVDMVLSEFREWVKGATFTSPRHEAGWEGL